MRILILSQYFIPETGAPQNRLFQWAKHLHKKGATVEVLTAMPNYPEMKVHQGYKGKFYVQEENQEIKIHRAWIYAGSSKAILQRLMNYFSFVFTSFLVGIFRTGKFDYVLCESPPLFLGITAYLLTVEKRARIIFNVSDLWPESAEKLQLVTNRFLLNTAASLERFLYRKSFLITGQTRGIVHNISSRFPQKNVYWFKNGADVKELEAIENDPYLREKLGFTPDDFLLLYAGIIGHAQGLGILLQAAANLRNSPSIKFLIMGSGPEKEKLLKMKEAEGLDTVFFLDSRPRKEVIPYIYASDAAVIPLRRLDLFKGAIPSKIFENLALKKPILLGVEGEAKELLIDTGKAGLAFIPEDPADLTAKILYLYSHEQEKKEYGINGYNYLLKEFNPGIIVNEFWNLINA
ncbi:MAG: glycosyltransferase family 4 protein [Bacteroidetes bacterium]|nr:glycosyltransferase family 4 protein [Bacteroidota bacterium]